MEKLENKKEAILLLLAVSGFISVTKCILKFITWTWKMFIRPPKNLLQYGSWAVITGPTDGIGKALAFELASKGLNLVLIGRNTSKLDATEHEIRNLHHHKVEIKKVVFDFAKCCYGIGENQVDDEIEDAIRGLDVGILINNAGLAYPYARYFHEVDVELMESIIKVNIEGVIRVTKAVIPIMLKKKKGSIVNIGSASSGVVPSYPLYSIYAATKARRSQGYVAMFSRSMSLEYKRDGIDIQCQIPGLVATKMARIKKPSLFVPSAENYSKASTRWIGYEQICVPYWTHHLQKFVVSILPEALVDCCLLKYFQGMRLRGFKRDSTAA